MNESPVENSVTGSESGTPIVINMPDYTPYLEEQKQLLETQNEMLMYSLSAIWILVAVGLIAVFFIAKGAGNNS